MPPIPQFHLDESVTIAIAEGLRRRGRSCTTTQDLGMTGAGDDEQIAYCRTENRVIVTADADFLRMLIRETDHPGVIYWASTKHFGQIIKDIDAMCFTMAVEEFRGKIFFL
jgi:predicted nuclease of predicted toxin-antitoxin system